MSWGEDERTEHYLRYCYSCGDSWKMSDTDSTKNLAHIRISEGCSWEEETKGGDFIICYWCGALFKKSELRKLIKIKSRSEILEIRIDRQGEYWRKKRC